MITKHACLDMRKSGSLPQDDCHVLRDEVNELPDNLAVVVTLRHLEGLTVEELSQRLAIKPNAARVRLFRAYERLRMSPRVIELFGWEN